MSKKVLSIDIGFGDCKVVYGDTNANIENLYKFNSVVGEIEINELIPDKRVYNYYGKNYYIGELALHLESSKIIDLVSYANLESFSPLIVKYVLDNFAETPAVVVLGLSVAHVSNSGYYRDAVKRYIIDELGYTIEDVYIVPQGLSGKLCIDKYGFNFPEVTDKFASNSTYLACDVGFNTVDVFQVINNQASPANLKGIEGEGVVKIARRLQTELKSKNTQFDFSLKECKDFLDKGSLKFRGVSVDLKNQINLIKSDYISELKQLIEERFGKILNKVDSLIIFGGGAYVLSNLGDPFIHTVTNKPEFTNSIGQYLYGTNKVK